MANMVLKDGESLNLTEFFCADLHPVFSTERLEIPESLG